MEFFKADARIPFMRQRVWAAVFSSIIFIASILALSICHLNLGLDFTGGTKADVHFSVPIDVSIIRSNLYQSGFKHSEVQAYDTRNIVVRLAPHKDLTQQQLEEKLLKAMPRGEIKQLNYIGPEIGKQLATNGILAVLVALMGTMLYIALRFDLRFAVSAAIAMIHDPILILGIFAFFHLNFDLIVLAGVLTVIGYSLNDTIVVYDRVRENFRKVRRVSAMKIMDLSINQTLSRTIMTSGLTLLVVLALYIFGGEHLKYFALALIIGIVVGTYSSIYIAGSLAVTFGLKREHLMIKKLPDGADIP